MIRAYYFIIWVLLIATPIVAGEDNQRQSLIPRQSQLHNSIRSQQNRGNERGSLDENPPVDNEMLNVAHILIGLSNSQPQTTMRNRQNVQQRISIPHRISNNTILRRLRNAQISKARRLHHAIVRQDYNYTKSILEEGVNYDMFRQWQPNLLHNIIRYTWDNRTKYNFIDLLVRHGLNPNISDENGKTSLHIAMEKACHEDLTNQSDIEYRDIIKHLIAHNADLNKADNKGNTPVHIAASSEQDTSDIIHLCNHNNADMNACNENKDTPLHCIINTENARALLSHNVETLCPNKQGNTPLHNLLQIPHRLPKFYKQSLNIPRDILKMFINNNASLEYKNYLGKTPLHIALQPHIIYELASHGANINNKDAKDNTLLALTDNIQIARACIQCGAYVNTQDRDRETPLHKAVSKRRPDLCQLLLRNDAQANIRNKLKLTPCDKMIQSNASEINKAVLYTMLQHNAIDINHHNRHGNTYLHTLAQNTRGKKKSIITLLSEGADATRRNNNGKTPHECASNNEKRRIFTWLENLRTMPDDTTLPQPLYKFPGIDEYKIMIGQGYPYKAAAWIYNIGYLSKESYADLMYDLMHSQVDHAQEAVQQLQNRYEKPDYALHCMQKLITNHSPLTSTYCSNAIARHSNYVDRYGNTFLHHMMRYKDIDYTQDNIEQTIPYVARSVMNANNTHPRNTSGKTPAHIAKKRKQERRSQLRNARSAQQTVRYICRQQSHGEQSPIYNRIMSFMNGFPLHNAQNR